MWGTAFFSVHARLLTNLVRHYHSEQPVTSTSSPKAASLCAAEGEKLLAAAELS